MLGLVGLSDVTLPLAVQVCFLEGLGEGARGGEELGLRTAEEPLPGLVPGPGMQGRRISDGR